jgi:hypothetical protein
MLPSFFIILKGAHAVIFIFVCLVFHKSTSITFNNLKNLSDQKLKTLQGLKTLFRLPLLKLNLVKLSRYIFLTIGLLVCFFCQMYPFLSVAHAAETTLAWDPNIEQDVAGYKIYYGTSSKNYTHNIDVGNTTEYTVSNLQEGTTYYFVVTAYNYSSNESSYSAEVAYTLASQNQNPNTPSTPSGPSDGFIQTNYNFSTSSSDPDGDLLQYRFDWGDGGISDWGGASLRAHAWSPAGNFCVKAQAKDPQAVTSAWSQCLNINIAQKIYTISAAASANGSIAPSGSVSVVSGDDQAFSISPYQSYRVADVLVDGASVGAVTSYTFAKVSEDHSISVSFTLDNQPPTADAGSDKTATEGTTVKLDGSNSKDTGGSIVGYQWKQTAGISVTLLNSNSTEAMFVAPGVSFAEETLTFSLTVKDNGGLEDIDGCSIYVTKEQVADSDGDGVDDNKDAFPNDPAEWLDSDGDGVGNNADEDDDDDTMPDDWELQYGLDPLTNDAAEDSDGDDVSNVDEYRSGTDPTNNNYYNSRPNRPMILASETNDVVSMTPELQTEEFTDPDNGDTHLKTQWQIFDKLINTTVFDIETTKSLTTLSVPKLVLDENTSYSVKVRFFDNHGTPSDWSESLTFSTDFNQEDTDGNGIPDHQELTVPTDMDNDGIPDTEQNDIKCVRTGDGTTFVGLSVKDNPNVVAIASIASDDTASSVAQTASMRTASVGKPRGKPKPMPYGLINFKLLLNNPGDDTQITVYLSERAPKGGQWFKYDPVEELWQDYSEYVKFYPNKKSLTIRIQDGGFGDADGIANGIIVDPAGLLVTTTESSSSSSDSDNLIERAAGCFISSTGFGQKMHTQTDLYTKFKNYTPVFIFMLLLFGWFEILALTKKC